MADAVSGERNRDQTSPSSILSTTNNNAADQDGQGVVKPGVLNCKTVYLIRHAETEENVKANNLRRAGRNIQQFKLPKGSDLRDGGAFLAMCLQGKTDAHISSHGREQICQMREILKESSFLETNNISVIAHSPLRRARETCRGMLGAAADGQDGSQVGELLEHVGKADDWTLPNPVKQVAELECLREVTPWENTVGGKSNFRQRVQTFENWLCQHSEDNIAVVGHSEYFMYLLGLPRSQKFKNCDVWKVKISMDAGEDGLRQGFATHDWTQLQLLHRLPCFLG